MDDLRTVQDSLARAGAVRAAYGPVQTLIWQVETFGFHLVEMEFRQHSVVHERALADIRARGVRGALNPETREALDTFRAIGSIQKRYGQKMARRYIVSFTKRAGHVADVYELARLAFAHADDVPELDVIPCSSSWKTWKAASACWTECSRCRMCSVVLPRRVGAWRSCWATRTRRRTRARSRPRSLCIPRKSA